MVPKFHASRSRVPEQRARTPLDVSARGERVLTRMPAVGVFCAILVRRVGLVGDALRVRLPQTRRRRRESQPGRDDRRRVDESRMRHRSAYITKRRTGPADRIACWRASWARAVVFTARPFGRQVASSRTRFLPVPWSRST